MDHFDSKTDDSNKIIRNVIQSLSSAMVYPDCTNEDTNRKLWDQYARSWSADAPWVLRMNSDKEKNTIKVLGDEWSNESDLLFVIKEFIQVLCCV